MYQNLLASTPDLFGFGLPAMFILAPVLVWSLIWKGWALWLAARRDELPWFVALLLINSLGIFEIFYIFVIAKSNDKKEIIETKVIKN